MTWISRPMVGGTMETLASCAARSAPSSSPAHLLARSGRGAGRGNVPAYATRHVRDVCLAAPQIARVVVLRRTWGGGCQQAVFPAQVQHGLDARHVDVSVAVQALTAVRERVIGARGDGPRQGEIVGEVRDGDGAVGRIEGPLQAFPIGTDVGDERVAVRGGPTPRRDADGALVPRQVIAGAPEGDEAQNRQFDTEGRGAIIAASILPSFRACARC